MPSKLTKAREVKVRIPHWKLLIAPWVIYGLGALLNVLVLSVNRSTFPVLDPLSWQVSPGDMLDDVHIAWASAQHLKFLADWISIPSGIASPGDLLIMLGAWLKWPVVASWLTLLWKDAESLWID